MPIVEDLGLCIACGHGQAYHTYSKTDAEWICSEGADCQCGVYVPTDWKMT